MLKEKVMEGKTKIIWKLDNETAEVESKDMITAGDGEKRDQIKTKGIWSNNVTCNVFGFLERNGINTHYIKRLSGNSFKAVLCHMFPVEVVMRRVATGSFLKRNPETEDGTVFGDVVIEFFLKDDKRHDPFIKIEEDGQLSDKWDLYRPKQPIDKKGYLETIDPIWRRKDIRVVREVAEEVFFLLEKAFNELDVDLIDMKIEFGQPTTNNIIVVADVIDNDSWRIRTKDGEQLDKQLYRDGRDLRTVSNKYEIVSELSDRLSEINF
jgi:phosphoribosylaminoimidazole-succinocarboxamide synthase